MYFSPRWSAMLGYADEAVRSSPDWRSSCIRTISSRVQNAASATT